MLLLLPKFDGEKMIILGESLDFDACFRHFFMYNK